MAKTKTPRTPREARTMNQICAIPRDNIDRGDYWMMLGAGEVTLAKQQVGGPPDARLDIPRRVFDAFVDWYQTGQWPPKRKQKVTRG